MTNARSLHGLLADSARDNRVATAVVDPGVAQLGYGELDALSDRVRDRLSAWGVQRSDRVGLYLKKSVDSIAGLFGALKTGAAYVPVDPDAPVERCAYILENCAVRVILTERRLEAALLAELGRLGASPRLIVLDGENDFASGQSGRLGAALDQLDATGTAPHAASVATELDDLAYILYTSGSTGRPKGVMLTHRNALSFVDWCSDTFDPTAADVFSSHAPLHFDLSI
ncbi:MAG TPA: AMP-binding protein, partial [Gemmatimonadaceae bacterium]|nr:AMP-binding protein [Gemmatimonadaceae bacterium]